ncbi:MAG: ribonuclease III [Ruminiclostridium sp.]|nr:ribonuclease III [Ruminiclostridium sp.]
MKVLTKSEAKRMSPGALAFYGDSVYSLLVRRMLVERGDRPSAALHELSVGYVRASFQARAFEILQPLLDEEEADILRRGRNSTGITAPKSSDPAEYHKATAVEALFGYLSLIGDNERLETLFAAVTENIPERK